ncbi:orotate phosphoribosyltransferase [Candidatus Woesearchaeota archaeon]|nr:orotate phosphoribosyltransferase [Candidatus Woesearchaeota archaeon]
MELPGVIAGIAKCRRDQTYTFASGWKSPLYLDNRALLGDLPVRQAISEAMLPFATDAEAVAGVATAGIPWAAFLAMRAEKPLLYVRPAPKDHGTGRQVEGPLTKGMRVLLVEDLVTTGGSSLAALQALRREGALVKRCVAIFSYGFAEELFREEKCELRALVRFEELLSSWTLGADEKRAIMEWHRNPAGWTGWS